MTTKLDDDKPIGPFSNWLEEDDDQVEDLPVIPRVKHTFSKLYPYLPE